MGTLRSRAAGWMLGSLLVLVGASGWADEGDSARTASPQSVIEQTAGELSKRLDGRRDYLADNPEELYAIVDEVLLPNFDRRYASYLVLGKRNWRSASADQRDRFVEAFFKFLSRSYAGGLLEFDPASLEILPADDAAADKLAIVNTRMRLDNGSVQPVDYLLRKTAAGWKVYDVLIQGISNINNYGNQFQAEIAANGIDSVIERLTAETRAVTAAAGVGGKPSEG